MRQFSLLLIALLSSLVMVAQAPKTEGESNEFTIIKQLPITSIKDQANSGTCWSYSTIGFLESEILRKGGPEVDLSDMFVVNHTYRDKAEKYVRLHGKGNLAQGGSFYDVLYVFDHYGAVPEEFMTGLNYGTKKNAHSELEAVLKGMLDAVVENHNGRLSTAWKSAYDKVVDTYLGELPKEFTYNGKRYTPKSFAESLGIKASDYVSLTSYTHHPSTPPSPSRSRTTGAGLARGIYPSMSSCRSSTTLSSMATPSLGALTSARLASHVTVSAYWLT